MKINYKELFMKRSVILIILIVLLSINITANSEISNEISELKSFDDNILDNMISLNDSNAHLKIMPDSKLSISLNGIIEFSDIFNMYKSPYDDMIVLECIENEEIISAQIINSSKQNRLINKYATSDGYILQIIMKKSNRFYLYEKPINNTLLKNLNIDTTNVLPEEKLFLLDWWLKYLKPTKTTLCNNYNNQIISPLHYNNRTETKTLVVKYDRFDIEYTMDVVAELDTYDIGKSGQEEEKIYLYIPSQSQYENGIYRDNRRVLLIKDPLFNFELVTHYGKNNTDGFTSVTWSCPTYYISRPKFKFGMSKRIWDWIEFERHTIGGTEYSLLHYHPKEFGCQVIGATDAEEISVAAMLKKRTSGDYRHKPYVDIDFEYCYYNYNTVIGSEKMYIAGYIDAYN